MNGQTIQIPRRGPGRPPTRNAKTITLHLNVEAIKKLRELAHEKGLPRSHVVEELILNATKEERVLELRKKIAELENEVKLLKEENLELRKSLEKTKVEFKEEKELLKVKSQIERVMNRVDKIILRDLMKRAFNLRPGESLMEKTKRFVEEYFVEDAEDKKKLISYKLGLVIEKTEKVGMLGWTVRKI